MILHINDNRLLREIQMDFSKFYPYLKMEFFKSKSDPFLLSDVALIPVSSYSKVGSVRRNHHQGALHLFPNTSVKDLEYRMKYEFSIAIQIYHYTKAGWIPTDVAAIATLEELNEQGRREFHELHNVAAQSKNLL
jgi:hypothetical protein